MGNKNKHNKEKVEENHYENQPEKRQEKNHEEHPDEHHEEQPPLTDEFYEAELQRLQVELTKLQEWIKLKGLRVVVVFEGRDAAGKGGTIKRILQSLNPRVCRVVEIGRAHV